MGKAKRQAGTASDSRISHQQLLDITTVTNIQPTAWIACVVNAYFCTSGTVEHRTVARTTGEYFDIKVAVNQPNLIRAVGTYPDFRNLQVRVTRQETELGGFCVVWIREGVVSGVDSACRTNRED